MRASSCEHFEHNLLLLGVMCYCLILHLSCPALKSALSPKEPCFEKLYLGSTWALDSTAFYKLQNSQSFSDQEFEKVEHSCLSSKLLDHQPKLFSNDFLVSCLDNSRLGKEYNKNLKSIVSQESDQLPQYFFLHILYSASKFM